LQTDRKQDVETLRGRLAVIAGGSGGIGGSIALALAQKGARICLLGRNASTLERAVEATQAHSDAVGFQADLTKDEDLRRLVEYSANAGGASILVHSAGVFHQELVECAPISDFDLEYLTNVRAPYRLTQLLLPQLIAARGQIVFINSTVGLAVTRPEIAQYAAAKHALRAIADSLRCELNPKGVRVLSVYLGRTATAMQEAILRNEGKAWHPETLLQPADVASTVVHALTLPFTAEITEVTIRPMHKL
jgi:NAD(P)-dependent dehydrogenase (short-subunit alcohol dehydrogenase family)